MSRGGGGGGGWGDGGDGGMGGGGGGGGGGLKTYNEKDNLATFTKRTTQNIFVWDMLSLGLYELRTHCGYAIKPRPCPSLNELTLLFLVVNIWF